MILYMIHCEKNLLSMKGCKGCTSLRELGFCQTIREIDYSSLVSVNRGVGKEEAVCYTPHITII